MLKQLSLTAALFAYPTLADEANWPVELVDPGTSSAAADLMLPMPCGAAMAFQRVDVPAESDDPLSDLKVRLGQSDPDKGFSEYLHTEYLRGGFFAPGTADTFYYIARYELTTGQYRTLQGDCAKPDRKDRLAQGGLTWFDGVNLSQNYTAWLYANAPDSLPRQDGALPFLRLPTETEWEYAARGGARIDPTLFAARSFFTETESLTDYAFYLGAGSSRGKLVPIGLRKPNPLGLYDIYGNAEELMLDPYRLNVLGRAHGQVGGVVTRGGSVLSTEDQVYSAQRTEYPPFQASTGKPTTADTFGVRLVLTVHVATSDRELAGAQARWKELAANAATAVAASTDPLADLIAAEDDPSRLATLTGLQAELRASKRAVSTAMQQSARSTLLAGAVFEAQLIDNDSRIHSKSTNVKTLMELQKASSGAANGAADMLVKQIAILGRDLGGLRKSQNGLLLSFRSTLAALSDGLPEPDRRTAFRQLHEELTLAHETALVALLDHYWRDLALFRVKADMDPEALLKLVLAD